MDISVRDASEYFRGLLLLMRMDGVLSEEETALVRRIGTSLGFAPAFRDEAIRDILENPYVATEAPRFEGEGLAAMFLRDGVALALSDGNVHDAEEAWLSSVAASNGLGPECFGTERALAAARTGPPEPLCAERLAVRYH